MRSERGTGTFATGNYFQLLGVEAALGLVFTSSDESESVAVLSDPLNNTTNPKSIPGAMQVYTLRITNQGSGSVDNNTVAIVWYYSKRSLI